MSWIWIAALVCFSILDTAILVPWAISRRRAARERKDAAEKEKKEPTA